MAYRQLWIFVEGYYDTRFIDTVIRPGIADQYDLIRIVEYASMKKGKLYDYLHSVEATPNSDYLFLKDINSAPCITRKRQIIHLNFDQRINVDRTIIVVKEIESWYLAGIDEDACNTMGIKHFPVTDSVTKEDFDSLIPHKFNSRDDFMIEILKQYSIEIARQKNQSFAYLMNKIGA